MKDLAVRLAALDPDAGAALSVIAYFDRLIESRAGLQAIVRGAAVLAGCPARLSDDERRVQIRIEPDGGRGAHRFPGRRVDVGPGRPGHSLAGTRGSTRPGRRDGAGEGGRGGPGRARAHPGPGAAGRPGLGRAGHRRDRSRTRTAAGGVAAGLPPGRPRPRHRARRRRRPPDRPGCPGRETPRRDRPRPAPIADLPSSWAAARTALRFTAEGTERDPGRRVVHADELGGLVLLAAVAGPDTEPVPDQLALDRAAATVPWMLTTLDAVAETASLRAAATVLRVHHSTLQDRLAHTIPVLGWDVREPQGRLRLQVAPGPAPPTPQPALSRS